MLRMHNPPHPGELLREFLPNGITIEEMAKRMRISRVHLSRILNGRCSISAEMAIRIGALTGTSPESWLTGQMKWDLWRAYQVISPEPAALAA